MCGRINQTWVKQQWRNEERWSTIGAVDDMLLSLVLLLTTLFLLLFVCGWGKKTKQSAKMIQLFNWFSTKLAQIPMSQFLWGGQPSAQEWLQLHSTFTDSPLPPATVHCKMKRECRYKTNVHSVTCVLALLWFSQGITTYVW